MKKIILLFYTLGCVISCNSIYTNKTEDNQIEDSSEEKLTYYGKEISLDNIANYENLKALTYEKGISNNTITGTIVATCPKKGCWMKLDTGDDTLFVKFRDYEFFVPTEGVDGKTAILNGDLFIDTTSIEMLQHYAEDAGMSPEEIALINEPNYDLNFIADGVIIKE